GIDGHRIGPDQKRALFREPHGREWREEGPTASSEENPARSESPRRKGVGPDLAAPGELDHARRGDEGVERQLSDRPSVRGEVKGRVEVGAKMRAHREAGRLEERAFD